jgi:signal transduction histidine kinase
LLLAQLLRSPDPEARSDVRPVLEDVVEELQPLARESQIELRLDHVAPSQVACGAGVLANMVSNLVGNSIKYMGDSAVRRVTITADTSPHARDASARARSSKPARIVRTIGRRVG